MCWFWNLEYSQQSGLRLKVPLKAALPRAGAVSQKAPNQRWMSRLGEPSFIYFSPPVSKIALRLSQIIIFYQPSNLAFS